MQDLVREIVERVAAGQELELVDMEVHPGKHPLVRVFIDKPGGVTVADCGRVTRELSVNFLVEDAIPDDTLIEVSSPGVDRPFRTLRDYERNLGRLIEARHAAGGKETVTTGTLLSAGPEGVMLDTGKGEITLPMESIKQARQVISF